LVLEKTARKGTDSGEQGGRIKQKAVLWWVQAVEADLSGYSWMLNDFMKR
jgi:hypothetical protein